MASLESDAVRLCYRARVEAATEAALIPVNRTAAGRLEAPGSGQFSIDNTGLAAYLSGLRSSTMLERP